MKQSVTADLAFAMKMAAAIVITHAIAYLTHEFSHSVTAWALGFMANPFALDYGKPTPANLVLLFEVADNVAYEPILQGGHGLAAAMVALAGPFVGNGLLYIGLYRAMKTRMGTPRPNALALPFWLLAMCAGNIWSYVPIRAITTHADIAIAAQGLHIDVLALFPVLLVPSLLLAGHFFFMACPWLIPAISQGRTARAAIMIALTTTWFFFLYGGAGLFGNYGSVAQAFSLVSMLLLMPCAVIWLWHRCVADLISACATPPDRRC
jgi:hypothetical protein